MRRQNGRRDCESFSRDWLFDTFAESQFRMPLSKRTRIETANNPNEIPWQVLSTNVIGKSCLSFCFWYHSIYGMSICLIRPRILVWLTANCQLLNGQSEFLKLRSYLFRSGESTKCSEKKVLDWIIAWYSPLDGAAGYRSEDGRNLCTLQLS